MNKDNVLAEMEILFLALADKTRLRLLNLIRHDEICVNLFIKVLGESQPKISRHLAYLRNAGIVEARREGKWIYYKIVEPKDRFAVYVLNDTLDWLETQNKTRTDYKKFADVCLASNSKKTSKVLGTNTFAKANMSATNKELEIFLL